MFSKYTNICEHCNNSPPKRCIGLIGNTFKTFFKNYKETDICISLSGGVDSMISSWILKQILPHVKLHAIHINYNNRDTTDYECAFLHDWCKLLNIDLEIVTISIKREDYMKHNRDFYEKETRQIRFDAYKKYNCPIVLGHNLDDCVENIISNIASRKNRDNLMGMTAKSFIDDVHIWRPMLNISKKQIYNYAKIANVPYLHDSTPSWSRRGKLRDIVIPMLTEHEPGFVSGLLEIAKNN